MAVTNFIDRIRIGDSTDEIAIGSSAYGECSDAANEQHKTVNIPGFVLNKGTTIHVKFTYANTASDPTLNVSNTGNIPLRLYGTTAMGGTASTTGWNNNAILTLTYDGSGWIRDQGYNTNSTYTIPGVFCNTGATTAAKVSYSDTARHYALREGNIFELTLRYGNTAKSALTLNVNSTGAKSIYINGSISSSTNYDLPAGKYLVYYDGTNYHIRTDGKAPINIAGSAESVPLSGITDADNLQAIEALTGTSGFLKKTAENTWTLGSGVTQVSTGTGLTGGDITSTGTIKANLTSETKLTNAAADGTETSGRVYPVRVDKNGKLAVNVPWTNVNADYLPLTAGVTAVTWDATNKKLTRTINGTAADVVTAAQISTALELGTIASKDITDYLPINYENANYNSITTAGVYSINNQTHPVTGKVEFGGAIQFGNLSTSSNYYAAQLLVSSVSGSASPVHAYIRRMTSNPSWSNWTTLLDDKNTTAPSTVPTLSWGNELTVFTLNGTAVKIKAMAQPTYAFDDLTTHPTTLEDYGITDATIGNGVITLGSSTITPITSINNHTGSSVTLTADDLGLSNALHFIGITSTELTDGDTVSTLSPLSGQSDSLSKTTGFVDGDVVIYDSTEFIRVGSKWSAIGDESSWAYRDHTHTASIAQAASGDTSDVTLAFGTKYKVTAGGDEYVFQMPSNPNTNTATRQQVSTTNKNYSLLFSALEVGTATNTSSYSTYRNDSVYVNPSTGIVTANGFIGDITGNADTATKLYTAVNIWGQSFDGSTDISGNMTDVGPAFYLPASETIFQFFTSTGSAAYGQFGKLGLYSDYNSNTLDLSTYTLDVSGAVRLNIGTADSSSDKKFIIYGNSRYLSIGGQGLQAYGTSSEAELYIQYRGGNIYFGQKMLLTNSTTPTLNSTANFTLSTSADKTLTVRSGSTLYLGTNKSASIIFQINGSTAAKEVARFNTAGHLVPYLASGTTTSNFQLGATNQRWKKLYVGTADSYGDAYTPIYWNDGVPSKATTILKENFTLGTSSMSAAATVTTTISNNTSADSRVIQIVVTDGMSNLHSVIQWQINSSNQIQLSATTQKVVSGYILYIK